MRESCIKRTGKYFRTELTLQSHWNHPFVFAFCILRYQAKASGAVKEYDFNKMAYFESLNCHWNTQERISSRSKRSGTSLYTKCRNEIISQPMEASVEEKKSLKSKQFPCAWYKMIQN